MVPDIKVSRLSQKELEDMGVLSWPIWSCDVSEFPWEYSTAESCLILEGEVEVVTSSGTTRFSTGDFVSFPKGLKCNWKVLKPVRKHYRLG